jgi:hypothetical protein
MAADYIASIFKIYGLQPGGDIAYTNVSRSERLDGKRPQSYQSYFQSFSLIEYKQGDVQELTLLTMSKNGVTASHFGHETDFSVQSSDLAIDLESPIIFAGYGYKDEKAGYNDFKGVDVKGKIILCISGYPGHEDSTSAAYKKIGKKSSWALRREKSNMASEMGVVAIIEVSPGRDISSNWASNLPFRYNSSDYEGDVARSSYYETRMKLPDTELIGVPLRLTISERVLSGILKDTDIDLEKFEETVKSTMKSASKEIPGKTIKLKTSVDSKMIRARNVVGVIPGKDTSEIIVIGGHYDHLGMHDGWIWNGADDNASGTVGVMTIAKAFMATGEQPEKTIVFAAWTGEEKGLLGSEYYADHVYNDAKVILNLNYDMISRDDKEDTLGIMCGMSYTKKYSIIEEKTKANNEEYELGLDIEYKASDRPRGGSDHSSFSAKDIPVMYYMAGFPPEYHQPGDHIDLVNFDKMVNIIKIGFLTTWDLANEEWIE